MKPRKVFLSLAVAAVCGAVSIAVLLTYGAEPEAGERGEIDRPAPRRGALDPEREARALEFMKQYFPDQLEQLERVKNLEPAAYDGRLREAFFQSAELEELKRVEPQEYANQLARLEARAKAWRLAAEMKKAPPERRAVLEKQLRAMLDDIFEERQRRLEAEVHELEQRLIDFREEVRLRRISEYAVIQERLAEYLSDAEPMRW